MGMHSKKAFAYLSCKYFQCWQVCPCFITEHPYGDWVRLASQESSANLRTTACRTRSDDIVAAARSTLLLLWSVGRGDFKHQPGPAEANLVRTTKTWHEKINAHALKIFAVPFAFSCFNCHKILCLFLSQTSTLKSGHSSGDAHHPYTRKYIFLY